MDTDLVKGCFGLVFICVHLRPSVVRLGGTVDENRSGVPLALPALLSPLRELDDERRSPERDSAFQRAPVPTFIVQDIADPDLPVLRKRDLEWFHTTSARCNSR